MRADAAALLVVAAPTIAQDLSVRFLTIKSAALEAERTVLVRLAGEGAAGARARRHRRRRGAGPGGAVRGAARRAREGSGADALEGAPPRGRGSRHRRARGLLRGAEGDLRRLPDARARGRGRARRRGRGRRRALPRALSRARVRARAARGDARQRGPAVRVRERSRMRAPRLPARRRVLPRVPLRATRPGGGLRAHRRARPRSGRLPAGPRAREGPRRRAGGLLHGEAAADRGGARGPAPPGRGQDRAPGVERVPVRRHDLEAPGVSDYRR